MSLLKADQLADVDAFADEFITSADKADPDVEEWENKHLGRSPVHRLSRIGRDAVDLRVMKKLDIEKATGLEVKEDPKVLETREQSNGIFINQDVKQWKCNYIMKRKLKQLKL